MSIKGIKDVLRLGEGSLRVSMSCVSLKCGNGLKEVLIRGVNSCSATHAGFRSCLAGCCPPKVASYAFLVQLCQPLWSKGWPTNLKTLTVHFFAKYVFLVFLTIAIYIICDKKKKSTT